MVFEVTGTPAPNREHRVQQLAELGFTWANLEDEAYWVDQIVLMEQSSYDELIHAAGLLWRVFDHTVRYVTGNRAMYEKLSIPEVLWDGLDRLELNGEGLISRYARFDFTVNQQGDIKLLELNADTPTGYVEASIATPWLCEQAGVLSPNKPMKELVRAAWEEEAPDYAACIAYGQHLEDTGTIDALVAHSGRKMTCVDCLDLWIDEGVVKVGEDRIISSMFALYPKEWMGIDDGGEALSYAIEEQFVRLFNPLHAVILQSKGLQAVVWGLHQENSEFYTDDEHKAIEKYMLPTFFTPELSGDYVSKSMFGREGGSVELYDAAGQLEIKDEAGFDTSVFFQRVYQQRADLPELQFAHGRRHLLTGLFVLNGTPCGLLGRAGGMITGNASQFVAIGVKAT
ncbi:glutathionylspermidine synthase family protein [Paenibacillus sp. GCM10023248]|uniref:glutathionylspermidine synthase family protein n=1 Tax=Bacillales TaxID=1385 RepID=UPI0023794C85|nr:MULTISPECIES: glutathionylspermidine synthase family protein [Bacillales]MDD9265960.1 glutathionylspermidine synthase family protein [Paenibacillus sp. MAHUQ-63]MDR6879199.1 glutathionylspermidine synthase [Bacillus sp. 3255]